MQEVLHNLTLSGPFAEGRPTFFAGNQPLWRFGWFGGAHVILGVHPELILSAWHDIAEGESVVEYAIRHSVPLSFAGVPLGYQVVQPVISFLIGRRRP